MGARGENGINFEVIWVDEVEDLLQIVFWCSNGYFSGQAEIYVTHRALSKMAETLQGFPLRPDDLRDFELGTFHPDHAGGGARMHFYCGDSAGHAVVEVKLRGGACEGLGEAESVALRIPIQAAGVDNFIQQVKALGKTVGASASLRQAIS
jgi:hypothetical protein